MAKSAGEKFEYVEAHPTPCARDVLQAHLVAFVAHLIAPPSRSRWRLNLIDKPERAIDELCGWIPLDERYTQELTSRDGWPQHIEEFTGPRVGVYYCPGNDPVMLRASEAASFATENYADAILSIIPGRLAVFFNHEHQVWLCKR